MELVKFITSDNVKYYQVNYMAGVYDPQTQRYHITSLGATGTSAHTLEFDHPVNKCRFISLIATGEEMVNKMEKIIEKDNELYITCSRVGTQHPKPKFEKQIEECKKKREEFYNQAKPLLDQLKNMGCNVNEEEILVYPYDYLDDPSWYETKIGKDGYVTYTIGFHENTHLARELEKVDLLLKPF